MITIAIYAASSILILLFAGSLLTATVEGNRNGLAKDAETIVKQWGDYMFEVKWKILPGIRDAKWSRKLHKLSAFGEEWPDKMPRLTWYSAFLTAVVSVVLQVLPWGL